MNRQIGQTIAGGLDDLTYAPLTDDAGIPVLATSVVSLSVTADGTELALGNTPSIDGNGILRYVWAAGEVTTLTASLPLLNVRVEWSVSDGADTFDRVEYVDIVAVRLRSQVTDGSLTALYPPLNEHRPIQAGVAMSGSTTTIVDTARLKLFAPNQWQGATVVIRSPGANLGQIRFVKSFDGFTGTLTLDQPLPAAVSSGVNYDLKGSFNPHIRAAWEEIQLRVTRLLSSEGFASLLDGMDFTVPHRHLSLAYACESLNTRLGSDFNDKAADERAHYEGAIMQILAKLESEGELIETGVGPRYWGR